MKSFIIRLRDNDHSCKIAKECVEQAEKFNLKTKQLLKSLNYKFVETLHDLDKEFVHENLYNKIKK
jgi:hypothetical protein